MNDIESEIISEKSDHVAFKEFDTAVVVVLIAGISCNAPPMLAPMLLMQLIVTVINAEDSVSLKSNCLPSMAAEIF